VVLRRQSENAPLDSQNERFQNLLKTMKTNLVVPENEPRQRSRSTPGINYPAQAADPEYQNQRSESRVSKVLRPLDQVAQTRQRLYSTRILTGGHRASSQISRYVFEGNPLGQSPIRIGIFSGLSGDDEVGPGAVSTFLADLVAIPQLGNGLRIYAYPVASPLSFETATPSSRRSQYIINQIGCEVFSSDTYQIEREIFAMAFDGIITVRSEEEITNFKVGISDPYLHGALVRPILSSLRPFLPNIEDSDCHSRRSLTAGGGLKQRPVELTLRVPSPGWAGLYSIGVRIALHTAVDCYRSYIMRNKMGSDLRIAA
jgi:hypothetical protein